ncbi:hypothetical protein [Streptomyces sp. LN245]|uniref:hypothetical protein n=1 Tax=Streptomyces sp. LN245 TaxID=3112975 RepID=UPI0037189460
MDVEFFLAPTNRSAATVRSTGPGRAFESLVYECFYPDDAVLEWESRLTGVTVERLRRRGEPRAVASMRNDGYEVFALSEQLRTALASVGKDALHGVARGAPIPSAVDPGRAEQSRPRASRKLL